MARAADSNTHDREVPTVSNVIRVARDGQSALPAQPRDAAAVEREMLDAAEQEAQKLLVDTREQIRNILVKARQDLVVLRGQIEAGHDHVRGPDTYTRHLVREVAGSIRPEIQALDREIAAIQHTVRRYREEIVEAPLLPEAPLAAEAPLFADEEPRPLLAEPAPAEPEEGTVHSRRGLVVAAVVLLLIATTGVAATRWWSRRPARTSAAPALARTAVPTTPARRPSEPTATHAPSAHGSHLVLEARQPVWIRVRTDGTSDAGRILAAGERRDISGSQISIRAGNAGALRVSVNGGAFEAFGHEGQPLTRDFGNAPPAAPARSDNAASTPAAASRPAPTPPPTAAPKVAATTTATPKVSPATTTAPTVASKVASPSTTVSSAPVNATRATPPASAQPSGTAAAQSSTPPQPTPASAAAAPEVDIVRNAEAWLMAFFNRDQAAMTRIGGSAAVVDDQRGATDRPPVGITVRRSLEQVRVQIVNNSALYTARLIETPQDGGTPFVSLISQVWLRSGNAWQMLSVRVMPESKVKATLR